MRSCLPRGRRSVRRAQGDQPARRRTGIVESFIWQPRDARICEVRVRDELDNCQLARYNPDPTIVSFRHRGLRRFFEDDDRRRLPPEQAEKVAVILARLDAAGQIGEMNVPGFRLHRLAGRLKGFGNAIDVDLVDYH